MSVLSVPLENDIASQKDIFRLAATLYSETSDVYSTAEAQLQMVKCMFATNENRCMSSNEIIAELLDTYKYHISKDEIYALLKKAKKTFKTLDVDGHAVYSLTEDVYEGTLESQKQSIDYFIDLFIEEFCTIDPDKCKDAIHYYLYELTTTNINSYRILLSGRTGNEFTDKELSVNIDSLSEDERTAVYNFLEWNNEEKNIALTNVVFCCLEYCLLVNGDSPNKLLATSIRNREVYLDTNVIFRALGINGSSRQKVVTAFLQKCRQANVKLIISHSTKKEFFDTIDYYVSQIVSYPKGHIYSGAIEQLSDYNIFAYYSEWRQGHETLSMKYFTYFVQGQYTALIAKYRIVDGEKISSTIFHSENFKQKRNLYSSSIKNAKRETKRFYSTEDDSYSLLDSHDATVVSYVELLREKYGDEKDIFFVSSDKILRYWDMTRTNADYPVVVYPSQLFLILIKLCGRSANDYDSFVSFINIRASSKQITAEKANIILSGISSITEDITSQKYLVSAVYSDEFQNIICHSKSDDDLYTATQEYSQNYLDSQLQERDEKISALSALSKENAQLLQELRQDTTNQNALLMKKQQDIESKSSELEHKREQLCSFAEKKIMPEFVLRFYVAPFLFGLATSIFAVFLLLQFCFPDEKWNFAVYFFNWVKGTTFGSLVGDFVYVIDGAFAAIIAGTFKKLKAYMRNPLNKETGKNIKAKMVERYIEKNNLS